MNTCLIYEQMCKLTSFVKHLRPRFLKYLREYLLVCIKWSKFGDLSFSEAVVLSRSSFPVNFVKFLRTPFLTEHLRTTASPFW